MEQQVPALTLLIPSADRPQDIKNLITSISQSNVLNSIQYEIVIADNSQSHDYNKLGLNELSPNLKIYKNSEHFDTAEENLFNNWKFCTGKYVWILGDDDPILWNTLTRLITEIQKNEKKLIIFNSNLISNNGQLVNFDRIKVLKDFEVQTYRDFCQKYGMLYAASGFSTTVIRRDHFTEKEALAWISQFKSKIYSHVTFLLSVDEANSTLFVDEALVNYRRNKSDEHAHSNHWENHSKRNEYFFRYPWLTGLNDQFNALEEKQKIQREFRFNVWEQDHFKNKFLLTDLQIQLFLEQVLLSTRNSKQIIPHSEYLELYKYFKSNYSFAIEYLDVIDKEYGKLYKKTSQGRFSIFQLPLTVKTIRIRYNLFKVVTLTSNLIQNKTTIMNQFYSDSTHLNMEVVQDGKLGNPIILKRKTILRNYFKYSIRNFKLVKIALKLLYK